LSRWEFRLEYSEPRGVDVVKSAVRAEPLKHAVEGVLRRRLLPRELFSKDSHYMLYRYAVEMVVGRVIVSESYIVLTVGDAKVVSGKKRRRAEALLEAFAECAERVLKKQSGNPVVLCGDASVFVASEVADLAIGVNDDGKLFVRDIDYSTYGNLETFLRELGGRYSVSVEKSAVVVRVEPEVFVASDEEVRARYLGYDYDLGAVSTSIVSGDGRYRVLGSLAVDYTTYFMDMLPEHVWMSMKPAVYDASKAVASEALVAWVVSELSLMGFVARRELDRRRGEVRAIITALPPEYCGERARSVAVELAKRLRTVLKIMDLDHTAGEPPVTGTAELTEMYMYCDITVNVNPYATPLPTRLSTRILEQLKSTIAKAINERAKKVYRVLEGDYLVEVESVPVEYTITLQGEQNPLSFIPGFEEVVVTVRHPTIYVVLPGYRMTVKHPVYGTRELMFAKPGIVSVSKLRHSWMHNTLVNRLLVDKIYTEIAESRGCGGE